MAGGETDLSLSLMAWRRKMLIVVFGVALAVCAFVFVARLNPASSQNADNGKLTPQIDLRSQRAQIGSMKADYRAEPNAQSQLKLLKSLYVAGEYSDVIKVARDAHAPIEERALYRGRALFAQGKFRQARNVADRLSSGAGVNLHALFLAARSAYALGDEAAALRDVRLLLQSDIRRLGGAVWALRARLALDENDFAVARSSVKRALEYGYDPLRADAYMIETALREGDLKTVREALKARNARFASQHVRGGVSGRQDSDGVNLAAILRLHEGAPVDAQRLLSGGSTMGAGLSRGVLLRVLANYRAGDARQALALLERRLNRAPKDWAALDLSTDLAIRSGDHIRAEELADRLEVINPLLAEFRRFQLAALKSDFNAAYKAVQSAEADAKFTPNTSHSFILGPSVDDLSQFEDFLSLANGRYVEKLKAPQTNDGPLSLLARVLHSEDLLRQQRPDAAVGLLDDVLNKAASFDHALLLRTLADVARGEVSSAQSRLQMHLAQNAKHTSARIWLSRLHVVSGDRDEAINQLANIINEVLNTPHTVQFYVSLLSQNGTAEQLEGFRKTAAKDMGDSPFKARTLAFLGDTKAAVAVSRRLLFADPSAPGRAKAYSVYMQQLGKEKEAMALLRAILKRNPSALDILTEIERLESGAPPPAPPTSALGLIESEGPSDNHEQMVFHFVPSDGMVAERGASARIARGQDASALLRTACFWGRLHACGETAQF